MFAPVPLSAAVPLIHVPNFRAFDVVPISGPLFRRLASLHRLPAGSGSPASAVLSRRYDFLSSVSRHSVSLDSRYRTDALSFLSRWTERTTGQPLGVGHPVPPSGNSMRRRQDLSSSRETSMFRLHLFQRPRTARRSQTITGGRCCPHSVQDEDADVEYFRGSIARLSDSLSTLRSAGYPDATQDSLPAAGHALPGGILPTRSQRKVS